MGEVALIVFPSTSLMLQHLGLHEHDTNVYCAQPSKLRPLRNALAKQGHVEFQANKQIQNRKQVSETLPQCIGVQCSRHSQIMWRKNSSCFQDSLEIERVFSCRQTKHSSIHGAT